MPKNLKEIDCIFCKRPMWVDIGAKAGLCDKCVHRVADAPEMPKPVVRTSKEERIAKKEARLAKRKAKLEKSKTRGKGKGWHLKKLFEFDGQFYSFGKEITDAEAAKLKKSIKKDA